MSAEDHTELPKTDVEEPTLTPTSAPEAPEAPGTPSPMVLEKKAYLFNQFYFDLLKKLKKSAKQKKEKSKEARAVLRAIKHSYVSYETGSIEYIQKFRESVGPQFWKEYCECPVETADKFLLSEQAFGAYVYHQISVDMIAVCLDDTFVLHHYLAIFAILMQEMTDEDVARTMDILKNIKNAQDFGAILNTEARRWVARLHTIYSKKSTFGDQFADIESTSLGKLAKEIMEEVDLTNLQNSIGTDGDVFKALTDPNSGIANLLGTVSQKMISKLASGEIKQENLLQDAMKFATKIPGLAGGGAGGGGGSGLDLGKITSMMQGMLGGGAEGDGEPDMGSLMNMVQGMMGKGAKSASTAKNTLNSARKSAQLKKMRERMKKKENVPDQ